MQSRLYKIMAVVLIGVLVLGLKKLSSESNFVDISAKLKELEDSKQINGASWVDYDNDGHLDLFVLAGDGNKLYKNMGGEEFVEVANKAGLMSTGSDSWAGVFGDFDNDGCADLYVSNSGQRDKVGESDRLYRNNCNGTFTEVSDEAGVKDIYHGRGAAWVDYNNDGDLDIYVANHGPWDTQIDEPNLLYKNNGDGTFTEVAKEVGVLGLADCPDNDFQKQSFQPVFFDYNNDNFPDLFVATDTYMSPLYKNNGDGTFSDVTRDAGMCIQGTGMGAAVGDYNNDELMDLYVTNTGQNYFWKNNGDGTFTEVSEKTGTADLYSLGWGTSFFDYDNDGLLDLYVVNGNVEGGPENNILGIAEKKIDKLYKNKGDGVFEEVGEKEGVGQDFWKETAAFADFNEDGFIDIFINSVPAGNHRLYKNKGNQNNWLKVKLIGTKSNKDSVGARVKVEKKGNNQIREVVSGSSYLSQNSLWLHFGLGRQRKIQKLEVKWPSGITKKLTDIETNQEIVIVEEDE